jgi:predicted ATPase
VVTEQNRFLIAVSGGPGAGKTTTLDKLAERGFAVVPEVARAIIAERKAQGLSPRPSPEAFAEAILERDMAQYDAAAALPGPVFFDRSMLDALGGLFFLGALSRDRERALLQAHPYHRQALIFPPWEEIYCTDAERDQTYEEAVSVFHSVHRWYGRCEYELIEVPPGTVDERCDFILATFGFKD